MKFWLIFYSVTTALEKTRVIFIRIIYAPVCEIIQLHTYFYMLVKCATHGHYLNMEGMSG